MEVEKTKLEKELEKTKKNLDYRKGDDDVITQRLTRKVEQIQRAMEFLPSQK